MSDKKGGEAALVVVAMMPSMVLRILRAYLHLRKEAKRSTREFYQSLLKNGVPKHEAKGLADDYNSMISLRAILKGFK
jgi:uncharacterized membrane protein YgaE (UPF0421/DUF939 family)